MSPNAAPTITKSFCVLCDAEPGECEHKAGRYLEDIVYEHVPEGGWKVPPHERARWEAAPLRPEPREVDLETKDLEVITEELEGILFLDSRLEAKIKHVYELQPARVSSLTTWLLEHASDTGLRNPAGVLWKRLGELERRET